MFYCIANSGPVLDRWRSALLVAHRSEAQLDGLVLAFLHVHRILNARLPFWIAQGKVLTPGKHSNRKLEVLGLSLSR
jgi:hypothetical protein